MASVGGSILANIYPHAIYGFFLLMLYAISSLFFKMRIVNIFKNTEILAILIFIAYSTGLSLLKNGVKGISALTDIYIVPLFVYTFILRRSRKTTGNVMDYITGMAMITVAYSIIEFVLKKNFLMEPFFRYSSWHYSMSTTGYRISTTIGHPLLVATIYLTILAAMNLGTKRDVLKYFVISVGVLLTGSRFGFLLLLLLTLVKIAQIRGFAKRIVITISLSFIGLVLFQLGLFDIILGRFRSEAGSTNARLALIPFVLPILKRSLWGNGFSTAHSWMGETYSFPFLMENPWVMMIIDIGIVGTLLFTIMLISLFRKKTKAAKLIVFIFLLMVSSYNSIASHTSSFLFLLVVMQTTEKENQIAR